MAHDCKLHHHRVSGQDKSCRGGQNPIIRTVIQGGRYTQPSLYRHREIVDPSHLFNASVSAKLKRVHILRIVTFHAVWRLLPPISNPEYMRCIARGRIDHDHCRVLRSNHRCCVWRHNIAAVIRRGRGHDPPTRSSQPIAVCCAPPRHAPCRHTARARNAWTTQSARAKVLCPVV